jgi:hypothetical protein
LAPIVVCTWHMFTITHIGQHPPASGELLLYVSKLPLPESNLPLLG